MLYVAGTVGGLCADYSLVCGFSFFFFVFFLFRGEEGEEGGERKERKED